LSLDFVSGAVSPPDGSVLIGGGNSVCLGPKPPNRSWELPEGLVLGCGRCKMRTRFLSPENLGVLHLLQTPGGWFGMEFGPQGPTVRFLSGTQMLRSEDDILNESEEDELSDEVRWFFLCLCFSWWLWLFFLCFVLESLFER